MCRFFEMYSRKLAEVDAQIERLQAIRAALLTRQPPRPPATSSAAGHRSAQSRRQET